MVPTCEGLSIWAECHTVNIFGMLIAILLLFGGMDIMPREGQFVFAGMDIPQAKGVVLTSAGKGSSIGTEHHAIDTFSMSRKRPYPLAGRCVPEAYIAIAVPTCEDIAISTRHALNIPGISSQRPFVFTGRCIPEADGTIVICCRERVFIWTERDAPHQITVSGDRFLVFTGRCIPEADVANPTANDSVPVRTKRDAITPPRCPVSVFLYSPVSASQRWMFPASVPLAKICPEGLNTMLSYFHLCQCFLVPSVHDPTFGWYRHHCQSSRGSCSSRLNGHSINPARMSQSVFLCSPVVVRPRC